MGEAATDPELLAVQKLLAEAAKEGYPEAIELAAKAGLLKLAERPSRAKADFLHAILADRSIGAPGGNPTCRAAAARALVGMGFPYALEIAPDDLALLKRTPKWGKRVRGALALLTALGGVGLTLAMVIAGSRWDAAGAIVSLAGGAGVLGGVIGERLCPAGTDAHRLARSVVWIATAGAGAACYFLSPMCVVPFVAGLTAEWITRPDHEKP